MMTGDSDRGGWESAADLWRRRKWLGMAAFAACLTGAAGIVTFLPDLYQATATVLVERQQVPEALVKPSVGGGLETRVQAISEEVLSRDRLSDLIARFGLYAERLGKSRSEAAILRMRRDIRLEFRGMEQAGGRGETVAFTLGYRGRDPQTVARVANTLASFFIQANAKTREQQASGTAEFINVQLESLKSKLEDQEKRVSDFKKRYSGELPEQVQANLATLERLNAQLQLNNENQVRALDPPRWHTGVVTGDGASSAEEDTGTVYERIQRLKVEIADLQTRFTDNHPDVIRRKAELAALERRLASTQGDQPGAPGRSPAAGEAGSGGRVRDLRALRKEEKDLRQAIALYQRRVETAPLREQELRELSRDYETSKDLYDSMAKRDQEARLTENMEQRQKGEQFRILDSAVVPEFPVAPPRLLLLLLGLGFSLAAAVASMLFAEQRDTSFHSVESLRAFTRVPVLARIPLIVTKKDALRRLGRACLGTVSALVGLVLIAGVSYILAHGNESLVLLLAGNRP